MQFLPEIFHSRKLQDQGYTSVSARCSFSRRDLLSSSNERSWDCEPLRCDCLLMGGDQSVSTGIAELLTTENVLSKPPAFWGLLLDSFARKLETKSVDAEAGEFAQGKDCSQVLEVCLKRLHPLLCNS